MPIGTCQLCSVQSHHQEMHFSCSSAFPEMLPPVTSLAFFPVQVALWWLLQMLLRLSKSLLSFPSKMGKFSGLREFLVVSTVSGLNHAWVNTTSLPCSLGHDKELPTQLRRCKTWWTAPHLQISQRTVTSILGYISIFSCNTKIRKSQHKKDFLLLKPVISKHSINESDWTG